MWVLTYYYSLILSLSCYDFLTIALLLSFAGSMGESFRLSTFSKLRKEFVNRLVRFLRRNQRQCVDTWQLTDKINSEPA